MYVLNFSGDFLGKAHYEIVFSSKSEINVSSFQED